MPRGEPVPFPFWPMSRHWPAGEQTVAVFLWSCPLRIVRGREGLFPCTEADIANGIAKGWGTERVALAMEGLQKSGWVLADQGWVFITAAMEHVKTKGTRTVAAAVNRASEAPRDSILWDAYLDAAELYAPELRRALLMDPRNAPWSTRQVAPNGCPKLPQSVAPSCPNGGDRSGDAETSTPTGHNGATDEGRRAPVEREVGTPAGAPTLAPTGVRDTTPHPHAPTTSPVQGGRS